jgi:hypothetical protein
MVWKAKDHLPLEMSWNKNAETIIKDTNTYGQAYLKSL